jgi:ribosomal protein L40E
MTDETPAEDQPKGKTCAECDAPLPPNTTHTECRYCRTRPFG